MGEGVELLYKAAKQGDAAAMYDLGRAYEKGLGVDADNSDAMTWYKKAGDASRPVRHSGGWGDFFMMA